MFGKIISRIADLLCQHNDYQHLSFNNNNIVAHATVQCSKTCITQKCNLNIRLEICIVNKLILSVSTDPYHKIACLDHKMDLLKLFGTILYFIPGNICCNMANSMPRFEIGFSRFCPLSLARGISLLIKSDIDLIS